MPESFEDQSELIWRHLGAILRSAGMEIGNLVFLRTYLARPEYMEANKAIRKKHLGDHEVGITVVCDPAQAGMEVGSRGGRGGVGLVNSRAGVRAGMPYAR